MQNEREFDHSFKSRHIHVMTEGAIFLDQPFELKLQLSPAYEGESVGLEVLPAHWTITSSDVELVSVHDEVRVTVDNSGDKVQWIAEFDLLHSPQSASDIVPLRVIPRGAMCELDVQFTSQHEDRSINLSFNAKKLAA
jgi:hypothetical protein